MASPIENGTTHILSAVVGGTADRELSGGAAPYESGTAPGQTADGGTVADRQPKGDHNRRLALGLDVDAFAAEAGISADELREYEQTWPDHDFDLEVARRIGAALERLERNPPATQKVTNGPQA